MGKDPPKEKGRNEIKYEGEVKGKRCPYCKVVYHPKKHLSPAKNTQTFLASIPKKAEQKKKGKVMIKLMQVACKRCGRPILTAEKAIHGDSSLKTRLGNICSNCITPKEKRQVEDGIAMAIHLLASGRGYT